MSAQCTSFADYAVKLSTGVQVAKCGWPTAFRRMLLLSGVPSLREISSALQPRQPCGNPRLTALATAPLRIHRVAALTEIYRTI